MLPEARAALARGRQLFEAGDEAGSLTAFEREDLRSALKKKA